jgi:hypothetical protein
MVAAGAAIFAGWLAWSAVQFQIAAEERRAAADRVEVEQVLQGDLDHFAEGLGAVWKILERFDPNEGGENNRNKLEGITYGIEHLTKDSGLALPDRWSRCWDGGVVGTMSGSLQT